MKTIISFIFIAWFLFGGGFTFVKKTWVIFETVVSSADGGKEILDDINIIGNGILEMKELSVQLYDHIEVENPDEPFIKLNLKGKKKELTYGKDTDSRN